MNEFGLWCPETRAGKRIWAPPPGAAEVAIEQLRLARLKRTQSTHVFICPRLLSPLWRRHLYQVADCVVEISVGQSFWSADMHEPLVCGICFPFILHRPWQLRQTPALLGVARMLQRMWRTEEGGTGIILQQLCASAWSLGTLSPSMVWRVLHGSPLPFLSRGKSRKRRRTGVEEEKRQ